MKLLMTIVLILFSFNNANATYRGSVIQKSEFLIYSIPYRVSIRSSGHEAIQTLEILSTTSQNSFFESLTTCKDAVNHGFKKLKKHHFVLRASCGEYVDQDNGSAQVGYIGNIEYLK